MMVLFSLAVVKRLKSDWIRSVLAFVHMIMSLDMLKKDPKSKALCCQHTSFQLILSVSASLLSGKEKNRRKNATKAKNLSGVINVSHNNAFLDHAGSWTSNCQII